MKHLALILSIAFFSNPLFATQDKELQQEIKKLQAQTEQLKKQLHSIKSRLVAQKTQPQQQKIEKHRKAHRTIKPKTKIKEEGKHFHTSSLLVHTVEQDDEMMDFYPTALIADGKVLTYVAGTPVVTSPYLGARPAFDGSDYIVNISSINRDLRLMEQRRRLYRAYKKIGYPKPNLPIIALSGKAEPVAVINRPYYRRTIADLNLGSSELDVAAALNDKVEAYLSIAYDATPPPIGPRVSNSLFSLNMGFVNIGDLDKTPFYFTAGQLFVPFGRYSTSMVSATLPLRLTRTKSRPFILGYKSQANYGPYVAGYGFKSDTGLGHSGIGGVNAGYTIKAGPISGDLGLGYISSITDSTGMQDTGATPFTTFGGYASATNGTELIRKVPGVDLHGNLSVDRFSFTAEWVGASKRFRAEDLSFNGRGAKPQAGQLEAGMTFMAFAKPASLAFSYQWTKDSLALNLPKRRYSGVFNISIWKDTVESLEYRHEIDYNILQFANGASSPDFVNLNTFGTGRSSDAVVAQIGVFF